MVKVIKTLAIVVSLLIGAVAIFRPELLEGILPGNPDNSEIFARNCLKATGSETGLEFSVSPSGKSLSTDFSLGEKFQGSDEEGIVSRVLDCVERAYNTAGIKNDFHTARPMQLGLVADQWSDGEVMLALEQYQSTLNTDIINNFSFGPASGLRSELIALWCERNKACVDCSPNLGASSIEDAATVTIKLGDEPRVQKRYYGTAPLAGNRRQPWQLVEEIESVTSPGVGGRVVYECAQ